jgi:hypothetical protein
MLGGFKQFYILTTGIKNRISTPGPSACTLASKNAVGGGDRSAPKKASADGDGGWPGRIRVNRKVDQRAMWGISSIDCRGVNLLEGNALSLRELGVCYWRRRFHIIRW